MEHHHHRMLSIWLFIGVLLLIYGIIILSVSIAEYSRPLPVVLASYHLNIWAGALLIVIGSIYTIKFWPRNKGSNREK